MHMVSLRRRIRTIGLSIAIGLIIVAVFSTLRVTPAKSDRPNNLLFILADDLSAAEITSMPKLKELMIKQGMTFDNHFINVSSCCPSRATILSGQYSHNTQVFTNTGENGGFATAYALGIEKVFCPNWLQGAGYSTAHIGKYLNGYPDPAGETYIPPGWDEWYSAVEGNPYNQFDYTLNENGKLVAYGSKATDYGTDVYLGKAIDFIQKTIKAKKPFFIELSLYAPHRPATPAPRHANLFSEAEAPRTPSFNEEDVSDKPQYISENPSLESREIRRLDRFYQQRLQSLQAVDESIASLIATLKENNQLENTYIFFTSDNGFHLGQHRMRSGKQTPYETDIHVPLIIRGPGISPGTKQQLMTGNIDFASTFAELAGVKPPDFVDGRSLVPLFGKNPPADAAWRQVYLLENWEVKVSQSSPKPSRGIQEPSDSDDRRSGSVKSRRRQGRNSANAVPEFQGLRTKNYTYVEYATGEKELYDLNKDPDQTENLADNVAPALLEQLADRLGELRQCSKSSCQVAENKTLALSR